MKELNDKILEAADYIRDEGAVPTTILNSLVNYGCAELQDREYGEYEELDFGEE